MDAQLLNQVWLNKKLLARNDGLADGVVDAELASLQADIATNLMSYNFNQCSWILDNAF